MSIGAGFTLEEIREVVYEYQLQPHGQKTSWLSARGMTSCDGGGRRFTKAICIAG